MSLPSVVPLADHKRKKTGRRVFFDRAELSQLLGVYSPRVARGEWRDYAIDFADGLAIFSIFRHTHEQPLFAVAKVPGVGNRRWEYAVYKGPRKLARSGSLSEVLRVFDKKLQPVD